MSKKIARGPDSYRNEELVLALVPALLTGHGFLSARVKKSGAMKLVEAETPSGESIVFWLKQGWATTRKFSAVQFGMFSDESDPHALPDEFFMDYVADRVAGAKRRGASHALLVHMVDGSITNFVALSLDAVVAAYANQISGWPKRARNTKTPTLWFEDSRDGPDASCVEAVLELELPLDSLSGRADVETPPSPGPGGQKITTEVEVRLRQQQFRLAVGARYGWRCAVSGTAQREVLDAAHLPGKDWRSDNDPDDGVLIRVDLHRLLDAGLAQIEDGRFHVVPALRKSDYGVFHGVPLDQELRDG